MSAGRPPRILSGTILSLLFLLVGSPSAFAAERLTFVSTAGSDANAPCPFSTPCRTLQVAHDNTENAGTISVLTPGEYGLALTITKSINIVGPPGEFNIASVIDALTINIGPFDVVKLSGIVLDGRNGAGNTGIRFSSGGALHLSDCVIKNFRDTGVGVALLVQPSASARIVVNNCALIDNSIAVRAVTTAGIAAVVILENVEIERNTTGVQAVGATSFAFLDGSTVALNGTAFSAASGGKIFSFGNNALIGNTNNGPALLPLQHQ